MSDDIRQFFMDVMKVGAGGLITWMVANWRPRQQRIDTHDESQNKTIESQGRTLAEAWTMIERLEEKQRKSNERQDWLEGELRKYVNAYARAVRYIRDKLPNEEIPDFLTESNSRIKKAGEIK